jgi:hypothetical protein
MRLRVIGRVGVARVVHPGDALFCQPLRGCGPLTPSSGRPNAMPWRSKVTACRPARQARATAQAPAAGSRPGRRHAAPAARAVRRIGVRRPPALGNGLCGRRPRGFRLGRFGHPPGTTCNGIAQRRADAFAMQRKAVGCGLQAVVDVDGAGPGPASARRRPAAMRWNQRRRCRQRPAATGAGRGRAQVGAPGSRLAGFRAGRLSGRRPWCRCNGHNFAAVRSAGPAARAPSGRSPGGTRHSARA